MRDPQEWEAIEQHVQVVAWMVMMTIIWASLAFALHYSYFQNHHPGY